MTELDIARGAAPPPHIWGWEIPVYLFLGGLAAGMMIVSALLFLRGEHLSRTARRLSFAAPVLVSLGMGALFLDLAHKLHVLRFYAAFRPTSPMSWGAWILVGVYPVTLLFGLALLDDADAGWVRTWLARLKLGRLFDKARELAQGRTRSLAGASLALGVGLGVYTGILLSTLAARPLWNSALLGPLFLVSGLSTGTAFLLLFKVDAPERHLLARWDKWAIGVEVALIALLLIGLLTSSAAHREAAHLLLGGGYTAQFWSLVVIAGLLVPFALDLLAEKSHRLMPTVAAVLVLVGGFSLRWILVSAGQA